MAVGVKEVLRLGCAARLVKTLFVAEQWDLMRLKSYSNRHKVVGILTVQPEIPEITAPGGLEELFVIGRAAQHIHVAKIVREHYIRWRIRVGCSERAIIHVRKTIMIVLNIKLQSEPHLVQVAKAARRPPSLFGPAQGRKYQCRKQPHDRNYNQ